MDELSANDAGHPAGWYADGNGGQRYWDGRIWAPAPPPPSSTVTAQGTAMTAPRVLAEYERTQILRQVVDAKINSQKVIVADGNGLGRITARNKGPFVRQWGTTWAEVAFGNWLTHPAWAVMQLVNSVFTCGLWLPWWFYQTFKKPPLWRVSIDEYGGESWVQHRIPLAQRIQTGVVLILMLWWLGTVPQFLTSLGAMTR